ncbi:hypothetical protein [Aliivibrio sp. 1S128]|uniref:hypothetical protein n=1 Tax=Aliivibrio sp. 1S128 TaxID=1840085 RepID=UPI00080DF3C5|nr:hypothetical protein [Aliivibrio sp. 1S128]OCH12516.1 hypothetical protein A6E03_18690 [Aliivibrio sp. 1S128]
MLCQFKLIPGRLLTKKELQYILTPNELHVHLNRFTSLQALNASLPINLQRHIATSDPQGLSRVVRSIRQLVESGEWVALSLLNQQRSIDELHLAKGTGLQQRIDKVVNPSITGSRIKVKPTLLNVSTTASSIIPMTEKKNDNKIVIEFAGQWPNNAGSISISKLKNINEKTLKPKKDSKNAHRSLVEFTYLDDIDRSLYLTLPSMNSAKEINLLLSKSLSPVTKETEMAEWDNVLVPVVPMKKQGAMHSLYQTGFFYVVWKGEVWREIAVNKKGYFCECYRQDDNKESSKSYHVNITGSEFLPDANVSFERFELYQQGKKVFSGELDLCEQARVFDLGEEEVTLKFVDFDCDEIRLPTHESPAKDDGSSSTKRISHPMPHIWIPYKILGQQQTDCYVYYSQRSLNENDINALEADYINIAVSTDEMSVYSKQQVFEGDGIYKLPIVDNSVFGSELINKQSDSNIAAITVMPPKNQIILRYRICSTTDQPDDFFMLRNEEEEWSQKVYFRQAKADDEGFLNLPFSGWPKEVEEVDILRGASADLGTTEYELSVLKTKIKISELIG